MDDGYKKARTAPGSSALHACLMRRYAGCLSAALTTAINTFMPGSVSAESIREINLELRPISIDLAAKLHVPLISVRSIAAMVAVI